MQVICGIDEAGRGPIAGPVCAAAVVLPPGFPIELLDDSKRMTPKRRSIVRQVIVERATAWGIGWASRREIDETDILKATMAAMKRAFQRVHPAQAIVTLVLVDGNRAPAVPVSCQTVVKGDASIPEIMAASILAKTARDELMDILDARYPQWGFAKHKGYPTQEHREACRLYGESPIQRHTFKY